MTRVLACGIAVVAIAWAPVALVLAVQAPHCAATVAFTLSAQTAAVAAVCGLWLAVTD